MADTGWKSPSSTGLRGTNDNWSTPTEAYSSNDQYATRTDNGSSDQDQTYEDFTFGVPVGATIDGIEVAIEAKASENVSLNITIWNVSDTGGWSSSESQSLTTGESIQYDGGATAKWGATWIPSDFDPAATAG